MKKVKGIVKTTFAVIGAMGVAYEFTCLIMAKISPKTLGKFMAWFGANRLKAFNLYDDLYDDDSDFAKGCKEGEENIF